MRLTADMRLTRNSRLMNGWKIVGDVFGVSIKPLVQHGKASNKYFGEHIRGRHIYKQIWRPLVGEILTLEREKGNNHAKFAVSLLKHATVPGHVPREFSRLSWHFLRHGETITCEVTDRRKPGKATS